MPTPKAFLCYGPGDADVVTVLADDLARGGVDPWARADVADPGSWEPTLAEIQDCDLFVFAVTPASLQWPACLLLLQYALALNRPLLPVMLHEVPLEFAPSYLANTHFVDYRNRSVAEGIALAVAVANAPAAPPLPDPLPEPPGRPPAGPVPAGLSSFRTEPELLGFPHATRLFILGILGLLTAPLPIISLPVFIVAGRQLRQIDASGVSYANRDTVLYARRLGLLGIIWSPCMIAVLVLVFTVMSWVG